MKHVFARIAAVLAALALLAVLASCQPQATSTTANTSSTADATSTAVSKIRIATDATFPPMEFVDEASKEIVGFDIDLIKAIAEAGGFEVEVTNINWDGIFAALENGTFDAIISSVTINDERKQKYNFSEPYITAGQVLLVPQTDTTTVSITDLKGKTVAAQMGTTGAAEIKKYSEVSLKEYETIGDAVVDLTIGRVAGVVVDTTVAGDYVLANKDFAGKLKIVGTPMTDEKYGIVVKKADQAILDKINAGLASIKASGKLDEIKKAWNLP